MGHGLAFEDDKDIVMIQEMASKGWAFEGVTLAWFRFVQAEPELADFAFDFNPIKAGCDGFGEYLEIFEAGGWQHVWSESWMHLFKAAPGTTPIYTDNTALRERYAQLERFMRKSTLWCAVIAALLWVAGFHWWNPESMCWDVGVFALAGGCSAWALVSALGWALNHDRVSRL
jgi:hypothetical protein